jgi:hypothetical protein
VNTTFLDDTSSRHHLWPHKTPAENATSSHRRNAHPEGSPYPRNRAKGPRAVGSGEVGGGEVGSGRECDPAKAQCESQGNRRSRTACPRPSRRRLATLGYVKPLVIIHCDSTDGPGGPRRHRLDAMAGACRMRRFLGTSRGVQRPASSIAASCQNQRVSRPCDCGSLGQPCT